MTTIAEYTTLTSTDGQNFVVLSKVIPAKIKKTSLPY